MDYPQVASRSVESFAPGHIYAGISDVVTAPAIVVAGTYTYLQVLGRITASGKLKAHDPAASDGSQVAVALCAIPAVYAADANPEVIVSGQFNIEAVTFNASVTTDAAKLAAFAIGSQIVLKKTAFGA
jgi:phosphate-selective porin